jgi:hypothetical protein
VNEEVPPAGFVHFSDAITRLAGGMWGGMKQAEPVRTIKRVAKKASIGFGPWSEQAGKRLTAAVGRGELEVFVIASRHQSSKNSIVRQHVPGKPQRVPISVLKRLIKSRGSLTDSPIRPSIKAAEGDGRLLSLLKAGTLVIRKRDFDAWYRLDRDKGKWPSQRLKKKVGVGRPTKQTLGLRNAILAMVRDDKWNGEAGITALRRLVLSSGRRDVPSHETLTRLVDQLHRETGEPNLLRKAPARRKRIKKPG